jgi:predicted lipoprotein with Yx(FWY)xxD motif
MNPSRKSLSAVAAVGAAAAVGLAACGGGGDSTANATPNAAAAPAVAVKTISGKSVLAYRGHSLYSPTQEKSGKITCTGGCVKVWGVVKSSAKKGSKVGHLGSITRPGGKKQLTYKGKPLYTFVPEGKGKLSGDGLKDSFGGHKFSWHVVTTKKSTSNQTPAPAPNYGY